MASIHFFSEDITFQLKNKNAVRKWLKSVIIYEQHSLLTLNYIFCSDAYLLEINTKYLNHNYFTDVITFDNSSSELLEGDIFISIDRITDNATKFNSTFDFELFRVMVHGLLHLLGYNDHSDSEIAQIRLKENYYLSLIDFTVRST
ncbi:rRNA maturation RNase YbeY [Rhodocytophaga aerolata]|uniref:Endoribonuclease YbeY n=1 Tax=Rhodocytophaga aerolata TaxID=455078 RepID=A0ABT8R2C2_9BACT|nr:rRNA maturation RNase YbeY [Rhodocytophaga aerolata]MDO1446249.1 rRNA maturation RNase YbeY [Rhodocytophaga aerolata]